MTWCSCHKAVGIMSLEKLGRQTGMAARTWSTPVARSPIIVAPESANDINGGMGHALLLWTHATTWLSIACISRAFTCAKQNGKDLPDDNSEILGYARSVEQLCCKAWSPSKRSEVLKKSQKLVMAVSGNNGLLVDVTMAWAFLKAPKTLDPCETSCSMLIRSCDTCCLLHSVSRNVWTPIGKWCLSQAGNAWPGMLCASTTSCSTHYSSFKNVNLCGSRDPREMNDRIVNPGRPSQEACAQITSTWLQNTRDNDWYWFIAIETVGCSHQSVAKCITSKVPQWESDMMIIVICDRPQHCFKQE